MKISFKINKYIFPYLMLGIVTIILILGFDIENYLNFPLIVIMFCIGSLYCMKAIRKLSQYDNCYFDPGLLFVFFVVLSIMPIVVFKLAGVSIVKPGTRLGSIPVLEKTTIAHFVLIVSFTFWYLLMNIKITYPRQKPIHLIHHSKVWLYLAITLVIFNLIIFTMSDAYFTRFSGLQHEQTLSFTKVGGTITQQLIAHLHKFELIVISIALGIYAGKASSRRSAYARLFTVVLILFIWKFVLHGSRGAPVIIGLGAMVYADIIFWDGKLVNKKLLLTVLIVGVIGLQAANLIERYYRTGLLPTQWMLFRTLSLDSGIVDNGALIISKVNSGITPVHGIDNYLLSIRNILPVQIVGKTYSLSEWYAWNYFPDTAEGGTRFGFSAVAEGYLSGRMFGVFIHGLVLAVLASIIKVSRRIWLFGPFLFCSSIRLCYWFFRTDSSTIVVMLRNSFIDTFLIVSVVFIILSATGGGKIAATQNKFIEGC